MALAAHWGTQILNQLFKLKKKNHHQTPNNNSTTAVKFSQIQRCSACIADTGSRYRNSYELLLINLKCLFKLNNICFCCLSCRCPPFGFFFLSFQGFYCRLIPSNVLYITFMKCIGTREKQTTLFLNKDPRIRGNVFPLTGDGVRTKNAADNGSPVL